MSNNSMGEVLTALLQDQSGQMSVIVPGEVVSWDSTTETVTAAPQIRDRSGEARPEIHQCPVIFPGVYWDLQVGETGLLLVCDEDFSSWWRTGEIAAPLTRQNHDIGNAVFLAGFRPSTNARTHVTDAVVLDKPAVGGEVLLGDPGATKAALHEDLLPDFNTFLSALSVWGSTDHGTWTIAAAAWTASVTGPLATIVNGIATGAYQSPSVKVED
jgi:hypothetical protein